MFSGNAVSQHGRGPQSARLVAVRSGVVLVGFVTGDEGIDGHTIGRTSASSRFRIYFDAAPDVSGPGIVHGRAAGRDLPRTTH